MTIYECVYRHLCFHYIVFGLIVNCTALSSKPSSHISSLEIQDAITNQLIKKEVPNILNPTSQIRHYKYFLT
jgi:hypothetical protein